MIKTKLPRYQTLIERSITVRGSGTEKQIAGGLNAAAKFR
jgi:hypothetical protein